jgi:hypothetical protein
MKGLILQSNYFIARNDSITTNSSRVLSKALSMVDFHEDNEFKPCKIYFSELSGYAGSNIYTVKNDIVDELLSATWEIIHDEFKNTKGHYVSSVTTDESEGCFTLRLNPDIAPFFLKKAMRKTMIEKKPDEIEKIMAVNFPYTSLPLASYMRLQSKYERRWYELGRKFLNFKKDEILLNVDYLRSLFEVEDKYKVFKDFKKRCITKPLEAVNGKTDIVIELLEKTKKQSRKTVGLYVKITSRSIGRDLDNVKDAELKIKIKKEISELPSSKNLILIAAKYGIVKEEIPIGWAGKFGIDVSNELIKICEEKTSKSEISNFGGFLINEFKKEATVKEAQKRVHQINSATRHTTLKQKFNETEDLISVFQKDWGEYRDNDFRNFIKHQDLEYLKHSFKEKNISFPHMKEDIEDVMSNRDNTPGWWTFVGFCIEECTIDDNSKYFQAYCTNIKGYNVELVNRIWTIV